MYVLCTAAEESSGGSSGGASDEDTSSWSEMNDDLMTSDSEGEEEETLGSDYRGGGGSSRGRGVGGYLASLTGGWPSPKESPPWRGFAGGGGVGEGEKVSEAPATVFGGPSVLTGGGLRLRSSAGDRVWTGGSASGSGRGKYYSAGERGRRVMGGSVSPGECVTFGGFLAPWVTGGRYEGVEKRGRCCSFRHPCWYVELIALGTSELPPALLKER